MKTHLLFTVMLTALLSFNGFGQVAINIDGSNPDASAILDVKSSDRGFLLPRMTEANRNGINGGNLATGLMVYQTDNEPGLYYYDGSKWIALATTSYSGAIYRWATFSTYNQSHGWYADNNSTLFGGVSPANWSDAGAVAADMSSDKQILLALFSNKGYAGKNALIYADEWYSYSSTNGKFAAALFRIENETNNDIYWVVDWYCTSYGLWGEKASITVNGANTWNSAGSNFGADNHITFTLIIPAIVKALLFLYQVHQCLVVRVGYFLASIIIVWNYLRGLSLLTILIPHPMAGITNIRYFEFNISDGS